MQITAVAASINVDWTFLLSTLFKAVGKAYLPIIFVGLAFRVYWKIDIESDQSFLGLLGVGKVFHSSSDSKHGRFLDGISCDHLLLRFVLDHRNDPSRRNVDSFSNEAFSARWLFSMSLAFPLPKR